jgi:hypothetical protein
VTTDSNHNEAIAPNSLNRNFGVVAPNKIWTTDITYVWTLKAGYMLPLCWIYFRGKLLAGQLMALGGLHYVLTHCRWHPGVENRNRDFYSTQIEEANRPVKNTVST